MDTSWTDELLSDAQAVVVQLLATVDDDLPALAERVRDWRDTVHREARPQTDTELADTLADATLSLLARVAHASLEERHLASVAARYFVSPDDADDDLASPFGFDDDVEVFNAVALRIAPDLVVTG